MYSEQSPKKTSSNNSPSEKENRVGISEENFSFFEPNDTFQERVKSLNLPNNTLTGMLATIMKIWSSALDLKTPEDKTIRNENSLQQFGDSLNKEYGEIFNTAKTNFVTAFKFDNFHLALRAALENANYEDPRLKKFTTVQWVSSLAAAAFISAFIYKDFLLLECGETNFAEKIDNITTNAVKDIKFSIFISPCGPWTFFNYAKPQETNLQSILVETALLYNNLRKYLDINTPTITNNINPENYKRINDTAQIFLDALLETIIKASSILNVANHEEKITNINDLFEFLYSSSITKKQPLGTEKIAPKIDEKIPVEKSENILKLPFLTNLSIFKTLTQSDCSDERAHGANNIISNLYNYCANTSPNK